MRHRSVIVTAFVFGLTITAAHAQLSRVDQRCRDAAARTFAKTVNTAAKVSGGCHAGRNAGKVADTIDCNDLSTGQADVKSKFLKAQEKLEAAIAKSCTSAGASDAVQENFVSCPEPCATATGVGNPLSTYAEIGTCLACVAGDIVERRNEALLGAPLAPMTSPDARNCHRAIAKSHAKHLRALLKERQACQKDEDAADNLELQPCDTSDARGKIADAAARAATVIEDACAGADLSQLDSCSSTDVAALNACLLAESDARGGEAFAAGYETAATICPVRIDATVLAGSGTRTFTDLGWTGLAHRVGAPGDYTLSMDVTCPTSGPCGACTIDGVSSSGPQYPAFVRCRHDSSVACNEPFGPDADDCGHLTLGDECVYFVGPPVPESAGNTPTCTVNRLSGDLAGTVNPDDGSWDLSVEMRSITRLGIHLARPCPVCSGDVTARDGVRDGVCLGGDNSGGACDIQASDATFAPAADGLGLSTDCPPTAQPSIDSAGVQLTLSLTTGSAALATSMSCDAPFGFVDCWCGACSGDPSQPCTGDADCAATATGTCTKTGGAAASRQPNDCSDLTCVAIADGPAGSNRGQCNLASDTDMYCDGVVRSDGRGYVLCDDDSACDNADCDPSTPAPDGCGDCTISERRACFLDPIAATGEPDADEPFLVSTFCVPPHNSATVNAASGLPGPARTGTEMSIDLGY